MHTSPDNLVELVEARANESPQRTAYTYLTDGERAEENLTYGGLATRVRAIAGALQVHHAPGARVVLLYPPGLDYISAFLGCLHGGFVAVPAYPPDPSRLNRTLPRLQAIVNDAGAEVVLTTSAILGMMGVLTTLAPDLATKRWAATDALGVGMESAWRRPNIRPGSLAFLQYTSGSTGVPKGVMLTHENLLANELMIRNVFKLTQDSVGVGWLPLYHDMGLIGNVLQTLYSGFRCILMSPLDFLHRPIRWLEAISRYGGTASGGPNFSYDLCVRKISPEDRKHLDLRSWKLAFSGAEPVRPETLDLFSRTFADCGFERTAFLPCYGLAEASLLVSGKTMGTDYKVARLAPSALEEGRAQPTTATEARALVSTGPAVAGSQVVVVDPMTSRACPPGRIGEIWVAGPHVAIGYWNDAEKSEGTFGARLISSNPELAAARFLRTGDLGFYLDAELHISGRLKDLIIIRGRNYYPQDIEKVVEDSFPTLRRGCSGAFSVVLNGEERLVVAVEIERRVRTADRRLPATAGSGEPRGPDRRASEPPPGFGPLERAEFRADDVFAAIRRNIAQAFSLHVHAIMLLKAGTIPKTSSGKIQRHACCAGYLAGSLAVVSEHVDEDVAISVAPLSLDQVRSVRPEDRLSLLEGNLRDELARVLRVPSLAIDMTAPLSGLGLDSLMAVEINRAVERSLGVVLPITTFLREGSGRDLAKKILAMLRASPSSVPPPRTSRPPPLASGHFPLSSGQEALWFLHQLAPGSAAYNISAGLRLGGTLDVTALEGALRAILARHPALHTTYAESGGRPVQEIRADLATAFALERIDASAMTDAQRTERQVEAAGRPFDLVKGPVFRATLLTIGPSDHVVVIAAHHIAADLWSIVSLLGDLDVLYSAAVRVGRSAPVGLPSGAAYRDFVAWQRDYLLSEGERDWGYWSAQVADAPSLDLPLDRPRPAIQTYRGAEHRIELPGAIATKVVELAKREGVTPYVILLATFQALLGRYSGQSTFLVGSPVAGRPRASYEKTVGYFVNSLPMRADLRGNPSVREHLLRVRETVLGALEHQDFPFALAVKRSEAIRDPSRSPLFQAMFVLEKAYVEQESAMTMIVLGATEGSASLGGLQVRSEPMPLRSAQFDLTLSLAQSGEVLAGLFEYNTDLFDAATIARMADHFTRLLEGMVGSPQAPLLRLALHDSAGTRQRSERWNATTTVYPRGACIHQLFEQQAAATPNANAVEQDSVVWSYAELNRRASNVASALQAAGAGLGARVAVLAERSPYALAAMLGVLKCGAVYVPIDPRYPDERISFMLRDCGAKLALSQGAALGGVSTLNTREVADASVSPPRAGKRPLSPRLPAYVIYTSGSTGTPKGVVIEHRSLVNYVTAFAQKLLLTPADRFLQFASLSFDASIEEIFSALHRGATLVLRTDEMLGSLEAFARAVGDKRISVLDLPTGYWAELALAMAEGIALPATVRAVIIGGEKAQRDTVRRWQRVAPPSIALYNTYGPTETTVVATWAELNTHEDGETPIGLPVPNAVAFVVDKHGALCPPGVPGELLIGGDGVAQGYLDRPALTAERFVPNPFGPGRLYRTGDRVNRREDGQLVYVGRFDDQVKVRGFRVELGEIETALRDAGAREAVVVAREDAPGDTRLVAYVVASNAVDALRARLKAMLPDYMIPGVFVVLDALPMTPNGKIDRKSLPATNATTETPYLAPRTPAEEAMCRIAAELLRVPRVGVNDNFFELGGHSLLATQFVSRVRAEVHVPINVRALFENPTVASLTNIYLGSSAEEGEI